MKKIGTVFVFLLTFLLLFTGCNNSQNTPTKRVEEFLGKYQSLDSEVLSQLDTVIKSDKNMSDEQKDAYRAALEKQYQNLSYKIKDEKIDGDTAVVDAEIEVLDYATAISEAKDYYREHKDEFKEKEENKTDDNFLVDDAKDAVEDSFEKTKAFIDYKIKQIENVNDKTKYTITFNLEKKDGKWELKDITDEDRQKLHGLYEA